MNNETPGNLDTTTTTPPAVKMYSETEVEEMVKRRRDRDAENLKAQHAENQRLKSRLEELESKMQKGTASPDEMQQLETAKGAAKSAATQGATPEQMQFYVEEAMRQKELENKLMDANKKDPEFSKLLKDGNKLYAEEVALTAYLPNAPAVVKQLMKDGKSLAAFRAAQQEGVSSMMLVLNNLSDRLESSAERPAPSEYKPAQELSDASDEDQNFDESNYIGSRY